MVYKSLGCKERCRDSKSARSNSSSVKSIWLDGLSGCEMIDSTLMVVAMSRLGHHVFMSISRKSMDYFQVVLRKVYCCYSE